MNQIEKFATVMAEDLFITGYASSPTMLKYSDQTRQGIYLDTNGMPNLLLKVSSGIQVTKSFTRTGQEVRLLLPEQNARALRVLLGSYVKSHKFVEKALELAKLEEVSTDGDKQKFASAAIALFEQDPERYLINNQFVYQAYALNKDAIDQGAQVPLKGSKLIKVNTQPYMIGSNEVSSYTLLTFTNDPVSEIQAKARSQGFVIAPFDNSVAPQVEEPLEVV